MLTHVNRDNLIVSPDYFEKSRKVFRAALDTISSNVVVFHGDERVSDHELAEHFSATASGSPRQISKRVVAAVRAAEVRAVAGYASRTFTYMPTNRCNMSCSYCGQEHGSSNASENVNDLFRNRVLSAIHAENTKHVHVAWFGGEPMLAYRTILQLARSFVAAARQSGTRYSSKMTTNGALLTHDRMRSLIDEGFVSRFDITVDGPPAVHDKRRSLKAGFGTFDKIVDVLRWYAEADLQQPCKVVIRTNVDRRNVYHIAEYLNIMKTAGLDDSSRFLYELAPVHSFSNDVSTTALSTPEAAKEEIGWMRQMLELGLPFGIIPSRPSAQTCVATDRTCETIGPDGTVFSCVETPLTHMAHLDSLAKIAELDVDELRPSGRFDAWDEAVTNGDLPCSSCQLRVVCRGACPKLWTEGTVACPTMKLNLDARIALVMESRGYRRISV